MEGVSDTVRSQVLGHVARSGLSVDLRNLMSAECAATHREYILAIVGEAPAPLETASGLCECRFPCGRDPVLRMVGSEFDRYLEDGPGGARNRSPCPALGADPPHPERCDPGGGCEIPYMVDCKLQCHP